MSPFGGFAQNFVLVGDGADGSGNNSNTSAFGGFAQNVALIGAAPMVPATTRGIFNFALVGSGVDGAGNNDGGGFNVAILPRPGPELHRAGLLQLLRRTVRELARLYR